MVETPVPVCECQNCHGTIWRQGNWFQCPDCGTMSTEFGGQFFPVPGFTNEPPQEFKESIDKVRLKKT